jgi:hypothetical protein
METLIALRLAERIVAVILGGIAIYLGYRLFLRTPIRNSSTGKFDLPMNTSITLTRVGPGVFFALFGTAIVGTSFYKQIDYTEGAQTAAREDGSSAAVRSDDTARRRFQGAGPDITEAWRDSARAELRKHLAALNTVQRRLDSRLSDFDRSRLIADLDRVKFALMEPVWGEWGDKDRFKQWIDEGKPAPPAGLAKAVEEFEWPQGRSPQ